MHQNNMKSRAWKCVRNEEDGPDVETRGGLSREKRDRK